MLPDTVNTLCAQQLERLEIKPPDGIQQLLVNTGNEGNSATGHTGHRIRRPHRHSFAEQDQVVLPVSTLFQSITPSIKGTNLTGSMVSC